MPETKIELDKPSEPQIAALADRLYDKVQQHPTLGPVVDAAVHDWPEHKRLLTSFWASVASGTRSYRGSPMDQHRGHAIDARHCHQWLALWRETADEMLASEHALVVHDYAESIARSLRHGLGLGNLSILRI